jgi:ribosome-associated protein
MLSAEQIDQIISRELTIRTSRSGGKGGQNVNKVESRVEIQFDPGNSNVLTEEQKLQIALKLGTDTGIRVVASEDRSQLRNKEIAVRKLVEMLQRALKREKKRKATRPSKASREKMLKRKKLHGEKKAMRRKPES